MVAKALARAGLVGLLLAASTATALAADTTVQMLPGNTFSPENITIQVGDTVTWVNLDVAIHDAVARDTAVSWKTGYLDQNEQAAVRFDTAGPVVYHCRIHPGMTGRIMVEAAAPVMPPTDAVGIRSAEPAVTDRPDLLAAAFLVGLALTLGAARRRDREMVRTNSRGGS